MSTSSLLRHSALLVFAAAIMGVSVTSMAAQPRPEQRGGNPAPAPMTPQAAAPIDLTGYWVSIVSKEWRWRMVTPARDDYMSVPVNDAAKRAAEAWDPAKDEAAGLQCKGYGAPALMRNPGRFHITWQDPTTLNVEADAGTQVRVLRFTPSAQGPLSTAEAQGPRTWQGQSVAQWQQPAAQPGQQPVGGSLKVVTANLLPGYLRKNGVPYSENATLTEYWDLFKEPNGEQWITITMVLEDPMYLTQRWVYSIELKKEPDGSKWDPTPCYVAW